MPYDAELQMFVQEPQQVNMSRLRFLRWLVEQDRCEHLPYGPAGGELVAAIDIRTYRSDALGPVTIPDDVE